MYNVGEGLLPQRPMTFQQYIQLSVVATASLTALTLRAQTTRTTEQDTTGTTITSITSLHKPRYPAPPFGTIDDSSGDSVSLNVSAAPDLTDVEAAGKPKGGGSSGQAALRGSAASQFATLAPSTGKYSEGVSGRSAGVSMHGVRTVTLGAPSAGSKLALQQDHLKSPSGSLPF